MGDRERIVALESKVYLLVRELRGHTHNSFSGDYFVGYPLRQDLLDAQAAVAAVLPTEPEGN